MAYIHVLVNSILDSFVGAPFEDCWINRDVPADLNEHQLSCIFNVIQGSAAFAYPLSKGTFVCCRSEERQISLWQIEGSAEGGVIRSSFLETIKESVSAYLGYLKEDWTSLVEVREKEQRQNLINAEFRFFLAFGRIHGIAVRGRQSLSEHAKINRLEGGESDLTLLFQKLHEGLI